MATPCLSPDRSRAAAAVILLVAGVSIAAEEQRQAPPVTRPRAPIAELWIDPPAGRDLFYGVGGRRLAPDPRQLYRVIEIKASGFSDGYGLVGPDKREWSAKFPPEASTEIIASRILWGIGYHQPPIYLLKEWRADGADDPNPQRPARFREKDPDFHGLDDTGPWAYDNNPFVGTRQMNALLVFQAMLGNSDLKPENNALYELDRPVEGARRWYVARDLGQTFGRTGMLDAPRGDIEVFEQTPFIRGVRDGRVELEYEGRHAELFHDIRVADVQWLCARLDRLTDRQWRDAFRAGGYDAALSRRFIRRLKQKIAEGLHLSSRTSSGRSAP
jgi:hypothetical protein